MRRSLLAACASSALLGCSGYYIYDEPPGDGAPVADAGIDTSFGQPDVPLLPYDTGLVDVGDTDPGDAWFTHFDAPHDPNLPPPEGTYSPGNDFCPSLSCAPGDVCDIPSGWCCSGRWDDRRCICGDTLGCVPPQVCCAFPDETTSRCVGPNECPSLP